MAEFLQSLFGGKPSASSISDDFANFATAASSSVASFATPSFLGSASNPAPYPYTAWYRVWERTQLSDFKAEAFLVPIALLIFVQLYWGRSKNRRKAQNWMKAHAPILEKEFASVGFSGVAHSKDESSGPTKTDDLIKEKTATEFVSYATGRQNVAFLDVKINLYRRFNPLIWVLETVASIAFAFIKAPKENVEAAIYTFDGKERDVVPSVPVAEGETKPKIQSSTYDGFVWAIVHKDVMKDFRIDRFDASLTSVKDNSKLPIWATVMSENAEITDTFLTPELAKAVETAGSDLFEYLLISDMPADKPTSLSELDPRKRLSLSVKLPSDSSVSAYDRTLPLFSHFVRLPDELVQRAHFRAEVQRKLKKTRDDETARVRRGAEEERAEERKLEADKRKKEDRESLLRTMSPAEQRKYLEKERDKDSRKSMRRMRA